MEEIIDENQGFRLLDHIPNGIIVIRSDYSICFWNACMVEWTGISADEAIGTNLIEKYPTLKNPIVYSRISQIFEGGPAVLFSSTFHPHLIPCEFSNGDLRVEKISFIPIQQSTGKYAIVLIEDMSDLTNQIRAYRTMKAVADDQRDVLKKSQDAIYLANEALRETTEYLNNLFDYANAPIITWDPGFHITRFNHAFEHLTGRNQEEVLGKTLDVLFPDETRNASMILIRKAVEGERWEVVEIPILIKDGSVRTVLWNSANILDPQGRIRSTIAQGVDITERIELEKEMDYHAQELQRYSTSLAMANKKLTLLSSITRHDINNQLTVQMGYLEILEDTQLDPSQDEFIGKVNTAAKRISAMVKFTKEYEEIGVHAPAWQDTRTLVNTAAKQNPLGKVIVNNELPAGTEVFADPLIVKVFYNLMDNAVRYGGKITIIRFSALERGGAMVIVCEDDGDGILPDEKEKIFERGFGKNTGLGLALSREILDITGITILQNGEPGNGARFEMMVPVGAWRTAQGLGD